jgi:ADP-L-glycero-D-manno-heptose 6-epimerase
MPDRGCYIVTGGAGFIGSNLAAALVKQDPASEVHVIDDLRWGSFANLVNAFERAGLPPFSGRLLPTPIEQIDPGALVATRGLRAVFHLAALNRTDASERELISANAGGFEPLLTACVQVGMPLVYASSAAVYGSPSQAAQRKAFPLDAAGRPKSPFGASKWLMESAHARLANRTALGTPHVVGLRYFDVFGPGEGSKGAAVSVVHRLATAMLHSQRPQLPADASAARDMIYVDDVVTATMAALGIGTNMRPRAGVYNVGSGAATGLVQILAVLRDELAIPESTLPTEQQPADPLSCGPDYTQADLAATLSGIGWKPASNPIEAIRVYARWLKARPAC